MDYIIRAAELSDAESMVELLNPIIADGSLTAIQKPLSINDQLDVIRGLPDRAIFHVAVVNQRVVGMQDVIPAEQHGIGDISTFVAADARRQGVGGSLFQVTSRAVASVGYRRLRAIVRITNVNALAWYQSLGFVDSGRRVSSDGPFSSIEQIVLEAEVSNGA